MKKQFIAIGTATVLALLGIVALISYANNADDRAQADTKRVTVLRVTEDIVAGTSTADLSGKTEAVKLPRGSLVPGALSSLDEVGGLLTVGPLFPGDQLTTAKFAKAGKAKGDAAVPKGMQEVAIPLDGPRTVGSRLAAGDKAGVFISYNGKTANPINSMLVLKVDGGITGSEDAASKGVVVTIAATTIQAEKIINGMEFGKVWLSRQNPATNTDGGKTITQQDVAP